LNRLDAGRRAHLTATALFPRRGRFALADLRLSSLFPFGLFHKVCHLSTRGEVLVFPEIFPRSARPAARQTRAGDETAPRLGWGHELAGLRPFAAGDDPRSIHWKQSARQGQLILRLRQAEEHKRLAIVFDNAFGALDEAGGRRFEYLISEAATAALDALEDGFEVALRTRDFELGFGTGPRHRQVVLETFAQLEARPREAEPLPAIGVGDELRVALEVFEVERP
jgi:uncharacterized protein (DUF58 family)